MSETSSTSNPKRFLSADVMQNLSETLAYNIAKDNFRPTFAIGLWRGGAQPGVIVQEFLQYVQGTKIDHIAIRTSSRDGVTGEPLPEIAIHAANYALEQMKPETRLLIIDDVWDRGTTIVAFLKFLSEKLGARMPREIKVACVFYKPKRNKFPGKGPDYCVEETDDWLVFPHELEGLGEEEIREKKPHVAQLMDLLKKN